jgi:kynureninase
MKFTWNTPTAIQSELLALLQNTDAKTLAQDLDAHIGLPALRAKFHLPTNQIYFCGNSLGLQPKSIRESIETELNLWQNKGVEGWFDDTNAWLSYHQHCQEPLARLVGGNPSEVCPMNHLSVNLHLMLSSFYVPTSTKYKILTIAGDFPSDQYALETHLKNRGYTPDTDLIEVSPRTHECLIHTEDILSAIETHHSSLALVCMSGLNYYTGQCYDMAAIAAKAQQHNIKIGFDLAHAIGNVPLKLHDWGVDFAVWCSYKYLNSGPGGVGGVFVHKKNHQPHTPRLAGWWGYNEATRFEMTKGFVPMAGAAGWQLSTPTIVSLAIHRAALAVFAAVDLSLLHQKSILLTAFLEVLLTQITTKKQTQNTTNDSITIITPTNVNERGAQLSLLIDKKGKELFKHLEINGVICDWREPNCIRLAPTPLYNTFEEVRVVATFIQDFL